MTEQAAPYLPPVQPDIHQKVKGPAYALIASAALYLVSIIVTIISTVFGTEAFISRDLILDIDMPSEVREVLEEVLFTEPDAISQFINVGNNIFIAILAGFILYGGLKMLRLERYGFCLTAAILTILPCSYCCCPCMFFGIWALVVLLKPEVKYAFYHQAT